MPYYCTAVIDGWAFLQMMEIFLNLRKKNSHLVLDARYWLHTVVVVYIYIPNVGES